MTSKTRQKGYVSKKERLPTFCGPQNWQTSSFLHIFDTNYCIFNTKGTFDSFWLNSSVTGKRSPRTKCWQTYPPQIWGAYYVPVGDLPYILKAQPCIYFQRFPYTPEPLMALKRTHKLFIIIVCT